MSVPDALMPKYYELLTDVPDVAVKAHLSGHPRVAKGMLAQIITAQFHGEERARKAAEEFDRVFTKKEIPEQVPEFQTSRGAHRLADLLVSAGMAPSKKEAQRLLSQGAVEVDGKRAGEKDSLDLQGPVLIQVGKRRFIRVVPL